MCFYGKMVPCFLRLGVALKSVSSGKCWRDSSANGLPPGAVKRRLKRASLTSNARCYNPAQTPFLEKSLKGVGVCSILISKASRIRTLSPDERKLEPSEQETIAGG